MTIVYKLTTADFKTRKGAANEALWGEGVTHTAPGGGGMCSQAYVHAYAHPVLAVLFNPIHANIDEPVLWECEAEVEKSDGLKLGCTSVTTLKRIALPVITTEQCVAFGIHCALAAYREPVFVKWADGWLDGSDRTEAAARAAARAGETAGAAWAAWAADEEADEEAAWAAAWAAAREAAWAAWAAARAAARAGETAGAAWAAAGAAAEAAGAAWAAARAGETAGAAWAAAGAAAEAAGAAWAAAPIDFLAMAQRAGIKTELEAA